MRIIRRKCGYMKDCRECSNSEHWEEMYGHETRYCHIHCVHIEFNDCEENASVCNYFEQD